MHGHAIRAFTLIELLIVLALISILIPMATSGIGHLVQDARLATALNDFHAALELSRSHALRSSYSTVICKSADGRSCTLSGSWDQGWLVFEDRNHDGNCSDLNNDERCDDDAGLIIQRGYGLARLNISLTASGQHPRHRIRFEPSGLALGYATTFSLCDLTNKHPPRGLVLSITGRIRPAQSGDNYRCSSTE